MRSSNKVCGVNLARPSSPESGLAVYYQTSRPLPTPHVARLRHAINSFGSDSFAAGGWQLESENWQTSKISDEFQSK